MRSVVPAAALAVAAVAVATLYLGGYREIYMTLLEAWAGKPFDFPFLDMHGVLAAIECHRRGIDVYAVNPCDVFGRVHVYSPLWLWGALLPITVAWTPAVGVLTDLLFLASLLWLPPGRGWLETVAITLGALSGVVVFALERANVDLVIFVLSVVAVRLVQGGRRIRLLGYAVGLFAGLLKFYPAALLIMAARERPAVWMRIAAVSLALIALWIAFNVEDLIRVLHGIPTASYFDLHAFGARNLPYGLAETFGWPHRAAVLLCLGLTMGVLAAGAGLSRLAALRERLAQLTRLEASFLLAGGALVVACFFTAQNIMYRGVFLLLVLPGLTAMARVGDTPRADFAAAPWLVLLLMWSELLSQIPDALLTLYGAPPPLVELARQAIWLGHEVVWWVVILMLTGVLFGLLRLARLRPAPRPAGEAQTLQI